MYFDLHKLYEGGSPLIKDDERMIGPLVTASKIEKGIYKLYILVFIHADFTDKNKVNLVKLTKESIKFKLTYGSGSKIENDPQNLWLIEVEDFEGVENKKVKVEINFNETKEQDVLGDPRRSTKVILPS